MNSVVYCVECEKLPVIYSINKLNHNQCMLLAKRISSFEYSSGAFPFLPDTNARTAGTLSICPSLQCSMQIEFPCYGLDVGRADKCSHCEGNNTVVTQELKQGFKTVLRLCKLCLDNRKKPFTQSLYGKGQK